MLTVAARVLFCRSVLSRRGERMGFHVIGTNSLCAPCVPTGHAPLRLGRGEEGQARSRRAWWSEGIVNAGQAIPDRRRRDLALASEDT
ncbi:hypothetical protein HYQ46_007283 [Verticillium longisporum]|nr:hypothetical protein HYQ46_007283 [Verticillium longisporum]